MTVSTELSHEEYVGNGVTTDFDFRFRIFEGKHLIVVVADSDGNEKTLKNGTDYTIVGAGSYHGGKVVLNKPLAQGWKILLERALPVVQETDLRNQGKFFAEVHEDAFDYLTMLIQKALGTFSLSLRKPTYLSNYYDAKGNRIANLAPPKFGSDGANKDYVDNSIKDIDSKTLRVKDKPINALPNTEQRANKILAFDDNGQPITVLPESGSASDVLIELAKPTGAKLINTNRGSSVQEHINGGMFTTRQLNITNSDQLVSALSEHGAIIVNSDVIIDKYTIIPSHSNVINGGGLFRLVNRDSCISIRPNVKFDCDIYDTSDTPLNISAIHIDGKIDNPRWYVGEHETKIKSFIRSNKRLGIAVFFDCISESNKRALISGVEIDVVVSRFEYACLMKADHSKYGIQDERKTYITSNRVSVVSGGSTYCLKELYSSDVKLNLEEIGGNVFYLEHQTVIEKHYPLHSVGRLSIYECNFWDSHVAENTDQIIVSGNDNYIFGANLPSRRSKYVSITGERNYYSGVTYGKPETSVNSLMINDTAHFLWGGARLPLSSLLDTTSNDIIVKGNSSSQGNVIFNKVIKDAMLKSPISIDVSTVFEMLDSNSTANIVLIINGYNFYLNGTSKVILFNIKIVANKEKIKIYGSVNNSIYRVERFGNSDNDDISIKMVVYSNKTDKSGELVFHEAKINFFQV